MAASCRFAAAMLLVVAALEQSAPQAQQPPIVSVQTSAGLHITSFATPQGRVSVMLPDDMVRGDRVSGTVRLMPNGADAASRERNLAELSRYKLEVGARQIPAGAGRFTTQITSPENVEVALSGSALDRVARAIPTNRAIVASDRYRFPALGQARMPLRIDGRFDGDIGTTELSVGQTPAAILAESPRRLVAQSPEGVVGPSELTLREAGQTIRQPFRNVALELTSPRTRLRRSEQTTVTAVVKGLGGLTQALDLTLSLVTGNVSMDGGNVQQFRIAPSDVGAGGTYTVTRTLTAAAEGGFAVSAVLPVAGVPNVPAETGTPALATPMPATAAAPVPEPATGHPPRTDIAPRNPTVAVPPPAPVTSVPSTSAPATVDSPPETRLARDAAVSSLVTTAGTGTSTQMPIAGMLGGLALLGVAGGLLAARAQAGQGGVMQEGGTDQGTRDSGNDSKDTRPEHETWWEEVDHEGIDDLLKKHDGGADDPKDAGEEDDPRDAAPVLPDPWDPKPDADDPRDAHPDGYFPEDAEELDEFNKWLEEKHGVPDTDDPRDAGEEDDPRDAAPILPDPWDPKPDADDPRDAHPDSYFPEDAEELDEFNKWLEEKHGVPDTDDPRDADVEDPAPADADDPRDLPVPAPAAATPQPEHEDDPRDEPVTDEELRGYIGELEKLKATLSAKLDAYNRVNAELEKAQARLIAHQQYLSNQIRELEELLAHWDPKKAPPKIENIRNRVIVRRDGPGGELMPPTRDDVKDVTQGYTRLMTQPEVAQRLAELRVELARSGKSIEDVQKRWETAWNELKAAGEAVARGWEELESALNNQNCHHASRDWSTPGPGGFQLDGKGFVTSWWMPPTIKLPEKKPDDPRDQGPSWADLVRRHGDTTCGGSATPPFKLFPDPPPRNTGGTHLTHPGGHVGGITTDPVADPFGYTSEVDWSGLDELEAKWNEESPEEAAVETVETAVEDAPTEVSTREEGETAPSLSDEQHRALERIVGWVRGIPGVTDADHPLSHLLLALASQLGAEATESLTRELTVGDPLTGMTRILERLAERAADPEVATQARLLLVQMLDGIAADPDQQKRWSMSDPARVAAARDAAISAFVDQAIRTGGLDDLATAFTLLARPQAFGGRPDDPRGAQIRQALEALATEMDAAEDAEPLERIRAGTLALDDLEALAADALERGKLPLFVEASLSLIDRRQVSLGDKVAQALALVELLRAVGATQIVSALAPRLPAILGPQLDEALRTAIEEAGRLNAVLEGVREADEDDEKGITEAAERLQEAHERLRDVARLKTMLATATLDEAGRRAALEEHLARANDELRAYEATLGRFKDGTAAMRHRATGRRDALRAARDAVQDLIFASDPDAAEAELTRIYEALNGEWHHKRTDHHGHNFREGGVRQRLDAALQEDEDSPEVRRLLEEMQYLERRRIQVLFLNPSWNALERWQRIKEEEARYWQSQQRWDELKWLGETQADRVLTEVGQFRARDLPGLLSELGRALEDPQGFIRYLAKLRTEDVRRGAQAWAAYYATPWQKRGLIVQTWRFMHVDAIQREIHQDRLFAQALTLAAENSVAQLRAKNPQAYQRLEQAGFIRNGEYVIPAKFTYTPESAGSRMSERHWSDSLLNVESISEMVATILLPGAAAGRLVGGLRYVYQTAEGGAAILPFLRLAATEGALFTLFSSIARGALHGAPLSSGVKPQHLAFELGMNMVTLGGLSLMNRFWEPLEKALLRQQILARTMSKPIGQVTRAEFAHLFGSARSGGAKMLVEAVAFTGLGKLTGGRFDAETFFHNLLFIAQLRTAHALEWLRPQPRAPIGVRRPGNASERPRLEKQEGVRGRTAGDIAENRGGRVAATPEMVKQFGEWLGGTLESLDITSSAQLRERLTLELGRIIGDIRTPEPTKQSARVLRSLLQNRTVDIQFQNQGDAHGGYNPVTRRATIYVTEIAKSLFLRHSRLGRRPTAREFVQAVLGTTAHEAAAHGLQGTDARRWVDGEPVTPRGAHEADGAGGLTRPYSELHEIEAYMEQRRFDPTLNGRDPKGGSRSNAEALREIIKIVNASYSDAQIQRRNERTLEQLDPHAYAEWVKVRDTLSGADARARLNELFFRHVYERGTPIAERVARAADRLRELRQGLADRQSVDARTRRVETNRNLRQATRDFLRQLGIDIPERGLIDRQVQEQLARRLLDEYQKLADAPGTPPDVAEGAAMMVRVLTSQLRAWHTQGQAFEFDAMVKLVFTDNPVKSAGGYRRHTQRAFLYLATAAESAEIIAREVYGRAATAEDFLRVLMGTVAHEALAHGLMQRMDLPMTGAPDVAARTYRRFHEMLSFLTQRLFDPYLGSNTTGDELMVRGDAQKVRQARLQEIIELVDQLYQFDAVQSQAESMLSTIDARMSEGWTRLRDALDVYESGPRIDPAARARVEQAMDALPLSPLARDAFKMFLGEKTSLLRMQTPEAQRMSLNELKMLILDELLATRRLPGQAVDRAVDRLRSRRDLAPRTRNVPAAEAAEPAPPAKPHKDVEVEARIGRLRDLLDTLRNRVFGDPLDGLPPAEIAHWRHGVAEGLPLRRVNEDLAKLAEIVRRHRAAGVRDSVVQNGLAWVRRQGLNDSNLEALENMLFVDAAVANGAIITITPEDMREFDRFAGASQVQPEFFDLNRVADIRAKAVLQAETGKPQLTRSDLAFIRQRIMPIREKMRSMFEFERAATDKHRAGLTQVFPDDFIAALRRLYRGGRPPLAVEDVPAPPPAPPAPPGPESPVVMFRQLAPDVQRRLLDDVTPAAVGFDLHRWRRAARGNAEAERTLLNVLRAANIGGPRHAASVAAEIDARLESVPAPPRLQMIAARAEMEKAYKEWRRAPQDAAAALRWLRMRVLLGGLAEDSSAAPFALVASGGRPAGPVSAAEAAQWLVADAAGLAAARTDPAVAAAQLARLAALVQVSGAPAGAQALAHLQQLAQTKDWRAFWPAFVELRQQLLAGLLREVYR